MCCTYCVYNRGRGIEGGQDPIKYPILYEQSKTVIFCKF